MGHSCRMVSYRTDSTRITVQAGVAGDCVSENWDGQNATAPQCINVVLRNLVAELHVLRAAHERGPVGSEAGGVGCAALTCRTAATNFSTMSSVGELR